MEGRHSVSSGLLMSFRIVLEGNTLRFAAAHMATFAGDLEALHGHNYTLSVEIEGELTADSWVLDFSEAKAMARAVCRELDHKFLLQAESASLTAAESASAYDITFGDRQYVMPRSDVVALPIDNTTAERLAEWIAGRLAAEIGARGVGNVMSINVGVEEAPGQSGWFRKML